jgi:DNA topoisomerase-1
VPSELKKTPWGQLGVNVEHDFEPLYVVPKGKTKIISELKRSLKEADDIYLATDEDREGESISWHLLQVLKPKVPVHRMVFHEITKAAIEGALQHPRDIDERLVRAQETRRILDRLVGYSVSPVLWKKIAYGLSAGRVQSVALKTIVDRERQRMAFKKAGYWDVSALLDQKGSNFEAKLIATQGKRLASGKDFDEQTGALTKEAHDMLLLNEERAQAVAKEVTDAEWRVKEVTEKPVKRRPPPPFITSTLQQEGNRKLGLSSKETMRAAQALYEKGHITYMRTDSVTLSQEAIKAARQAIAQRFGKEYVPEMPRQYASTSKGAQEAHEAIRPSLVFGAPDEIGVSGVERDVYELIWMRTLASQMPESEQLQLSVTLEVGMHTFNASGLKIVFPGFLRAYVEGAENPEQAMGDKERLLPMLKVGDHPTCGQAQANQHETKPPARFTEASLIQFMEKEGIGRPSTYATTVSTLYDRGYIRKAGGALIPTFTGMAVTQLLEKHFADLVDVGFTSKMEESLDKIAEGKEEWLPYLRAFYLGKDGLKHHIETELDQIDPEAARRVILPNLPNALIRVGKFGPYFEAEHPKSHTMAKASIPLEAAPADFSQAMMEDLLSKAQQGPTTLGEDAKTGKTIFLKTGSYGPYLQLGEDPEEKPAKGTKGTKPKRVSIPKHIPLETLNHDMALALLSLPRVLGTHPQTGKEVLAGLGRFGPYVVHEGEFRSIKAGDDVLTIELPRALELLAVPKGTRGQAAALKTLGLHPKDQKPVTLHSGKYGQYVKHGKTNATLPKDVTPEELTLERAVELLAEKSKKKKR